MPFNRFLPPEYGDGVDTVRKAIDGMALPSARFVSLLVHGSRPGEAAITLMTAQWGQLLDHDLTSTAQPRPINGSVPSCCGRNDFHPSCFPIKVPFDDPWLAPLKVHCLEFLRSAPAQRRDCVLSWREQTNQATSYLDASPIYSNHVKLSDNTRTFQNGTLIYGRGNPSQDVCQRGALATQCIRSGDGRSGEQPGLLALHQVWVSEHNRIALQLAEMNPHWSDEKLYQEARRIIGAMFQHITYREFLPIVLGRQVTELFNLNLMKSDYFKGYDPKVNPTIANSFSAAAFRFGHSLIQHSYIRCDRNHNILPSNVTLHEEFQRGDVGSVGSLHRLIRGLATQKALKRDEFITPELTNHLFQTAGFPFGLDLAAINIQRGRDHGIPPYTAWRVPCGLTPIKSWEDIVKVVGPESTKRIRNAYRSVHDIDLFVGGIAERPVVGGLVGPTFACIIAQQFSNLRVGDRFWYENGDMENSFTPAQLQSIRHVLFSQVLCQAVGGGTLQSHVFIPAEVPGNERLPCGVGILAPFDLKPWQEQDPFLESLTAKPKFPNLDLDSQSITNNSEEQILKKSDIVNQTNPFNRPTKNNTINADFQLFKNMTKIHDKLDITRKQTTKRPKPIKGINNKLEKDRKAPKVSPTKRKVVINNIPLELRTATSIEQTKETTTTEKTIKKRNVNMFNLTELNPMTHSSPKELKRVQRILNNENPTFDYSIDYSADNSCCQRRNKALNLKNKTISTKILVPIPESKQYYAERDYTTPHKVVLPNPHSDEYEIEINIRQTKKPINLITKPNTQYQSFPTPPNPYQANDETSAQHGQAYSVTPPYYGTKPEGINNRRTRPPTIIYLNEQDDRFTTKRPGLIQHFMSYTKPQTTQRNRHQYESIISSGSLAVSPSSRPVQSDSSAYDHRPLPHGPSKLPSAASTFSQIGTQLGGGTHISSAAVSTGAFGSITGSTNANGADTSFSFNIRPNRKPSFNVEKIVNYVQPFPSDDEIGRPDGRPNYMTSPIVSPTSKPHHDSYHDFSHDSPFSSAPKRPQYNYHTRTPNDILDATENKEVFSESITYPGYDNINNFDYFGKSFFLEEQNDTLTIDDFDDYNDLFGNDDKNLTRNVNNDEIFNPENMAFYILQKKETKTNNSEQKDNYVMALLNSTKNSVLTHKTDTTTERLRSTDSMNYFAKNSNTEIFAEEDEYNTRPTNIVEIPESTTVKIVRVPFAPIRILTSPERPDNWIMFAASKENDSLPESPSVFSESEVALEMPTPFQNFTNIWLTRLMTENDEEITKDTLEMTTQIYDEILDTTTDAPETTLKYNDIVTDTSKQTT